MVVVAGTMAAMARDFCEASWAIPRPTYGGFPSHEGTPSH